MFRTAARTLTRSALPRLPHPSLSATFSSVPSSLTIEGILKEYGEVFKSSRMMEKAIPRSFASREVLEGVCGRTAYEPDLVGATAGLSIPIYDMLDRGGKKWRPVLCMLVAEALGAPAHSVLDFAALCEIVHNGSLVVDDIEDKSEMRRGKPCSHILFGVDVAVNAGNGMYFIGTCLLRDRRQRLSSVGGSGGSGVEEMKRREHFLTSLVEMHEVFELEMANIHFGQAWDIQWQKKGSHIPTESQYFQMVAFKTGTLARLASKLACLSVHSERPPRTPEEAQLQRLQREKLGKFGETVGVAFQIQDDLLNLESEEYAATRLQLGEDITEGKRTLMVIHALANAPPAKSGRLLELLDLHTKDPLLIEEAIGIMRDTGSLDYARSHLLKLVTEAWSGVESVIPDSPAKSKLKLFADFFMSRSK